jgi:hypothetical protein
MDDEARRVLQHERREREVGRPRLPERGNSLVEDAVGKQATDDPVLALHEVEVPWPSRRPTVMPATRW